jgi:anti-anti-sigma factor
VLDVRPLEEGPGLALAGILDLATQEQARQAFDDVSVPGADVTLDLRGLEFMDSVGLNLIANLLQEIGGGGHLTVIVGGGIVDRLLGVSGLEGRPNVTVDRRP